MNPRLDRLTDYPFQRLAALLDLAPPSPPVVMSIGEPQHPQPALLAQALAENAHLWGKYPPPAGTPDFKAAVTDWLAARFAPGIVAAEQVVPVSGTREALYMIAQVAAGDPARPYVLLPNPFYQVYYGAAVMAGAEPVLVPATAETGFLPDFAALPAEVLDKAALAYLCSPANPQGSVADLAFLTRQVEAARRHGFVLASDECYSEIWYDAPPPGAISACAALGGGSANVVVFHSLSKRSSVPGLRSGFVAGDAEVMTRFARLRSYGGASLPLPVLAASAALWRDEAHVEDSRALYAAKMELARRHGFARPAGGFYLWLDVGDGEAAARKLWREAAIRVLPGAYLARTGDDGANPGARYIRVALVQDLATTEAALARLAALL